MQLSRRHFLATASAATLGGTLPVPGWAGTSLTLGAARIDSISDGHLVLPLQFLLGDLDPDQALPVLQAHGVSPDRIEPPCNITLLRDGTNTVLFDAGSGPDFMPSAGKMLDGLDALGLAPEDITHVVITHGHPDHIWGLLDDFDDPLFSEARHLIGRAERDYWLDPDTVNTIEPARTTHAVGAARRLTAIEDRLETFEDGAEILPGVAATATLGHTPGHMSFEIRQGSESLMVIGDAVTNHHLGFARPGWHSGADQDPDTGASTRLRLLERLAAEQMPLLGFHLPEGGIGRAERAGDGYRFVPGV